MAYKTTVRSKLEYAAPIWTPLISDTNWKRLEAVENAALRVATGCHLMASVDHLHVETKVIPIRAHCELLTKQYLLRSHLDTHPGRKHLDRPPPERMMKADLNTWNDKVAHLIPAGGEFSSADYKAGLKTLHTECVQGALNGYAVNKVLNEPAPPIHKSERELPRSVRSTLSQLRSSYCKKLNSYQSRINAAVDDICPKCSTEPHSVAHLFECKEDPTDLVPTDLWRKPKEAASFLDACQED